MKKYLLVISLLLFSQGLYAQQKPAFKLFFEKAYLHTDRDVYTQGDTIWFKAYLVNGQSNAPIGTSGNLYVELIQADSAKIMTREIIRLENGKGNGDIKLTDTIPSGEYTLRAYTNWMRNFGDDFVFEKRITVYNTETVNKAVVPIPAVADKRKGKLNTTVQPMIRPNVNINFYPEGGSMVEGLNSLVATKAQDAMGKGLAVHGAVLNASGDTVTHFSCDSLGMGMLSLLPLAGQKYNAEFNWKGINYTAELPQALTKGLAMRVNSNDTIINVVLSASDTLIHQLTLMGRHGGKVFLERSFTLTKQAVLKIPKSMFPEGIVAFTLYDEQSKPNCERLVYIHWQKTVNLNITTEKSTYQPKGKVTVKLKLSDTSATANLSMAVVDESLVPLQHGNIVNYLLLTSELKGDIAHPERYFDSTNINRVKQLDLLLMTQGWRDFLWRRVADSAIRITYAVEPFITLSGRVRQKFANKPLKNLNVSLTAFKARGNKLFSTRTDSVGHYYFDDLQLYGEQVVSLNASDDKGNKTGWILLDSLFAEPLPVRAIPVLQAEAATVIPPAITKAMIERQKNLKKHSLKDTIHLNVVEIKTSKTTVLRDGTFHTFGYPDQFYTITKADEYFEDLSNWMAHNIKQAHISGEADHAVYFFGYMGNKVLPIFIVNGKEVIYSDDTPGEQAVIRDLYFNLSMNKIKKVVWRHLVGIAMRDIFLVYLTITPDAFDRVELGKVTASVNGYYNARTFYKPVYDTPKSLTKPDYRTTIHWEPNITMGKNGEATVTYYNADPKTNVRVVVEGITSKGEPLVGTAGYAVK